MIPKLGPRELVYENRYQRIFRVVAQFEGFQKEYFVNSYGRKVGVLIADGETLLFVRQYRCLINGLAWELPGGQIEPDETPEQAAIRETLEETGLRCGPLQPLLLAHPGLDNFENPTFLFYTESFEKVADVETDPREIVERAWIPLKRAIEMIFKGEILDSMTITALLAFYVLKDK